VSTKTVNHRASKQPIKRDGLNEVNTPLEEQVEMAHITTAMLLKEDTDPIFLRISQESAVLLAAAEANLLLREVMKGERDLTEKRIQDIQNTISASDLLLEAEIDLNKSFRFKVIQELKENIIKVSQSMASRNQ
jgi:3-polyprenyl-4-hydroxybenzoate decarboxylase